MPESTSDQKPHRKVMHLPVVITDTEKLVILAEQSALIAEIEKLKAEKARLPEAIKTLEGALYLKNHALVAGVIEREVEIREEANGFSANVQRWRVDTGERLADRVMDPEEKQMSLGKSSVPGPTPDNVRSLAEHREKTEEQLAAGTPEEAEALRVARLADEAAARAAETVDQLMQTSTIEMRGTEGYIASVSEAPGLASGLAGPIRPTPDEAVAELRNELARLLAGTATPATPSDLTAADVRRALEIEQLAADQAADAAKDKPKRGLQVPKGAKGRRTKPTKEETNGVDTTPPPGTAF